MDSQDELATDLFKMWAPSSIVFSRTAPSHSSFRVEKERQVISCGLVWPPLQEPLAEVVARSACVCAPV